MITGSKFTFGFRKVERTAVGLSVACNEEYKECNNGGDVSAENEPVPGTYLEVNNLRNLHATSQYNCSNKTQGQ